jgi:hypothetical protein
MVEVVETLLAQQLILCFRIFSSSSSDGSSSMVVLWLSKCGAFEQVPIDHIGRGANRSGGNHGNDPLFVPKGIRGPQTHTGGAKSILGQQTDAFSIVCLFVHSLFRQ